MKHSTQELTCVNPFLTSQASCGRKWSAHVQQQFTVTTFGWREKGEGVAMLWIHWILHSVKHVAVRTVSVLLPPPLKMHNFIFLIFTIVNKIKQVLRTRTVRPTLTSTTHPELQLLPAWSFICSPTVWIWSFKLLGVFGGFFRFPPTSLKNAGTLSHPQHVNGCVNVCVHYVHGGLVSNPGCEALPWPGWSG